LPDQTLKQYSRQLRKDMTDAERPLWSKIRRKQINNCQFYRQRVIGSYIVDFYCHSARLVIELDGGQHFTDEAIERDEVRDRFLRNQGLKVLRFSDSEVFENTDGVLDKILEVLENPP